MTPDRVVIVGAGGTASYLAVPLARMLYYRATRLNENPPPITVIDGDTVEGRNLERQGFRGGTQGVPKAVALVNEMRNIYPASLVSALTNFVTDENVGDLIQHGDLIILAVDNHPARRRIMERANYLDDFDIVNTGNESRDGSINVWSRRNGVNTTDCPLTTHPEIADLGTADHDPLNASCAVRAASGDTQTLVANFWSAAMALAAVNKILTVASPVFPAVTYWDAITMSAGSNE